MTAINIKARMAKMDLETALEMTAPKIVKNKIRQAIAEIEAVIKELEA